MDSEPKRSFDRLMDEAARNAVIDRTDRLRLGDFWQYHRWKTNLIGFYNIMHFLAATAIVVSLGYTIHQLHDSETLRLALDWLGTAAGHVLDVLGPVFAFILKNIREFFTEFIELVGDIFHGMALVFRAVAMFAIDLASTVFRFAWSLLRIIFVWIHDMWAAFFGFLSDVFGSIFGFLHDALAVVFRFLYHAATWIILQAYVALIAFFEFLSHAIVATLAFAWNILAAFFEWLVRIAATLGGFIREIFGTIFDFLHHSAAWIARHAYAILSAVFEPLHHAASAAADFAWNVLAAFFEWLVRIAAALGGCIREIFGAIFGFLYRGAAAALGFAYGTAGTIFALLVDTAGAVGRLVRESIAAVFNFLLWAAAFAFNAALSALAFLYAGTLAAPGWIYARILDFYEYLKWHYWITIASKWAVVALFAASLLASLVDMRLTQSSRRETMIWPLRVLGAALFTWMLGHILEIYTVQYAWKGLEIASMGMWCVIPLFIAVLTGRRPLFYEGFAFVMLVVHLLAYTNGVSGNVVVTFDVSLAIMVIAAADILKARLGSHAPGLRYAAMSVMCFILYCSGFVWDLPAVLEFRSYAEAGSVYASHLAIVPALVLAALAAGYSHLRKGEGRTRHDALFALLLLCTLLYTCLPTGILFGLVPVGALYDLLSTHDLSIFAGNVLLASFLAWVVWFLWCLWILVESSDLNSGIMAQIAVTALLGSLETRYVEIVKNISFGAGLIVLPLVLTLVLVEIHIIRRWLNKLEGGAMALPAAEG